MSDLFRHRSTTFETSPLLEAQSLQKVYLQGAHRLEILKGIDLSLFPGEAVCVLGSSGAGKSTLLHIMGALDRPSLGRVFYKGEDLFAKNDEELARFRNRSIGFVFQFHHLLAEFTALENIAMPARIGGATRAEAEKQAHEFLELMGLASRAHHYPSELSGGEKQRVAISRALVQKPEILLADEPTGNLDTENGLKIQELFFDLKQRLGLTLLVVTHDHQFASRFPRVLTLKDGLWAGNAKH